MTRIPCVVLNRSKGRVSGQAPVPLGLLAGSEPGITTVARRAPDIAPLLRPSPRYLDRSGRTHARLRAGLPESPAIPLAVGAGAPADRWDRRLNGMRGSSAKGGALRRRRAGDERRRENDGTGPRARAAINRNLSARERAETTNDRTHTVE